VLSVRWSYWSLVFGGKKTLWHQLTRSVGANSTPISAVARRAAPWYTRPVFNTSYPSFLEVNSMVGADGGR